MQTTRFITALRFPLALLVVFIHSYNSVWRTAAHTQVEPLGTLLSRIVPTFAVPLFFAISGYLFFLGIHSSFSWHTYVGKLHRRSYSLLVPYLVWNFIAFGLYALKDMAAGQALQHPLSFNLLWGSASLGTATTNALGWHVATGTAPVQEPLWFVRDLMVVCIASPLIYGLMRHLRWVGLLIVGIIYYAGLWPNLGGFTFTSVWFFSLGAWFSISGRQVVQTAHGVLKPCATLLLPLLLALMLFRSSGNGWWLLLQQLYVLAAMVVSISIADFIVQQRQPNNWLSNSSFFVYASHTIVMLPVSNALAQWALLKSAWWQNVAFLLCPLLTIAICLFAYFILTRYMPRLAWLLTGKR